MTDVYCFPRYSQPGNFVTNNTLLLLQRLHDTNRFKFDKFLATICGEVINNDEVPATGLRFAQQVRSGLSVPDGLIFQESIKIVVETKAGTEFNLAQAVNHLEFFGTEKFRLLLLLSPTEGDLPAHMLKGIITAAQDKQIKVLHLMFHELIEDAKSCFAGDEETLALLNDYESFCSEWGLLPRDQFTMLVPPCGPSFEDNKRYRLYYCPASRNLRKTKYLGIYRQKRVELIGTITKTITCNVDTANYSLSGEGTAELNDDERQRILGAASSAMKLHAWDISTGHKFLLLGDLESTSFEKTSSGGIMGHRYFDLERILGTKPPANLSELASRLNKIELQ